MRSSQFRILYVGPDYPGSNGTCWRDAFLELGHEVKTVDAQQLIPAPTTLWGMTRQTLFGRPSSQEVALLNDTIVREARAFRPDMTFYIQARYVLPEVLHETSLHGPNLAYFNDDMFNPRNQSFTFFEGIKRINCILTTKSYNVSEFHLAGAPSAMYVSNAYDPKIHYPAKPSPEEKKYYEGDIAFLGTFRPVRADFLAKIAALTNGLRFNIWGGGWHKMDRPTYWHKKVAWRDLRSRVRMRELWCSAMGKAIQSNTIILGLLNHANRDLHTSRSFEIPACGGFMLAERTAEHQQYFEEDKEAVYFGSIEELCEKIQYYLAHETERLRIAKAGHERCLRSPYRYIDKARLAIQQYKLLWPTMSSHSARRGVSPLPQEALDTLDSDVVNATTRRRLE